MKLIITAAEFNAVNSLVGTIADRFPLPSEVKTAIEKGNFSMLIGKLLTAPEHTIVMKDGTVVRGLLNDRGEWFGAIEFEVAERELVRAYGMLERMTVPLSKITAVVMPILRGFVESFKALKALKPLIKPLVQEVELIGLETKLEELREQQATAVGDDVARLGNQIERLEERISRIRDRNNGKKDAVE